MRNPNAGEMKRIWDLERSMLRAQRDLDVACAALCEECEMPPGAKLQTDTGRWMRWRNKGTTAQTLEEINIEG